MLCVVHRQLWQLTRLQGKAQRVRLQRYYGRSGQASSATAVPPRSCCALDDKEENSRAPDEKRTNLSFI